jgi:hypothetical protein
MKGLKCEVFCLLLVLFFSLLAAQPEASILSETQPLSQNSEQSYQNSNLASLTLSDLQTQARSELAKLRDDLMYWKQSSMNASAALKQSIERVTILEAMNEQIATRMQERDEDLAAAYSKIKQLEHSSRGMLIAIFVLGLLLLVVFTFLLWRSVR